MNFFKEGIKNQFSEEVFNIFLFSRRILLYTIKESLITIDENKASQMCYAPIYFYPEISAYENVVDNQLRWFSHPMYESYSKVKLPENFEELRKEGENESEICKLIRNDSLDEFIIFIGQNNIQHDSFINYLFYEIQLYKIYFNSF